MVSATVTAVTSVLGKAIGVRVVADFDCRVGMSPPPECLVVSPGQVQE